MVKSAAVGRAYVQFALEEPTNYRLMFDISQPPGKTAPELEIQERRARALMSAHVHMLVQAGTLQGDADLIARVLWAALHGVIVLHLSASWTAPHSTGFFPRPCASFPTPIVRALMAEMEIPSCPAMAQGKIRTASSINRSAHGLSSSAHHTDTDFVPVAAPVHRRRLSRIETALIARRNVLEIIPSYVYRQPLVSGDILVCAGT